MGKVPSRPRPWPALIVGFAPGLLLLYSMLIPIIAVVAFGGRQSTSSGFGVALPDTVALLSLGFVPPVAAVLASFVASRARTGLLRFLAILAGLQSLGLAIAFILSASIAGISMAVVENVAAGWALKAEELRFALVLLLPMQVLLIPWAALTSFLLRRTQRENPSTDRIRAA